MEEPAEIQFARKRVKELEEEFEKARKIRDEYFNYMKQVASYNDIVKTAEDKGEAKARLAIARNMLAGNVDVEMISKHTKLSVEKIKELQAV